jgi:RNA recognition motif-containing protein
MDFVEDRRRKRRNRVSKFDVLPVAAGMIGGGTDPANAVGGGMINSMAMMMNPMGGMASGGFDPSLMLQPQQTRHARRLYVGNLPFGIREQDIHHTFTDAIRACLVNTTDNNPSLADPVISVYVNHEKRFAFVEFASVEMATACMQLDGMELGGVPVKIKRPNDYNEALAVLMAPHLGPIPALDVSKLGIVSNTVLDGPNKIFIGGLHYHLREDQVMELLSAFGKVKAFHLVKNESADDSNPAANYSKGYCFVEYADPAVTLVAIAGLNGMDIGNGKTLTVRLAGDRPGGAGGGGAGMGAMMVPVMGGATPMMMMPPGAAAPAVAAMAAGTGTGPKIPPPTHTVVTGYDVEELVDAALGRCPMPGAPSYFDVASGIPLTRIVPALWSAASTTTAASAASSSPQQQQQQLSAAGPSPAQVAAAVAAATAAAAAFSNSSMNINSNSSPPPPPARTAAPTPHEYEIPTNVLVLHNMVSPADLATEDDHQGLLDEVREECAKYGKLRTIVIPREGPGAGKIYLQYSNIQEAQVAQGELHDRQRRDGIVPVLPRGRLSGRAAGVALAGRRG